MSGRIPVTFSRGVIQGPSAVTEPWISANGIRNVLFGAGDGIGQRRTLRQFSRDGSGVGAAAAVRIRRIDARRRELAHTAILGHQDIERIARKMAALDQYVLRPEMKYPSRGLNHGRAVVDGKSTRSRGFVQVRRE